MYTYDRLLHVLYEETNDSVLAHYLLTHISTIHHLTVNQVIEEVGISKASLHRFFHKAGFSSFKQMTQTLQQDYQKKQNTNIIDKSYKQLDKAQIKYCKDILKNASKVVLYGNTDEIACFKKLKLLLFSNGVDVFLLDRWDLQECEQIISTLKENDVFLFIDTKWQIQHMYEESMHLSHILNLQKIHQLPFHKFFVGNSDVPYLTYTVITCKSMIDVQALDTYMIK